MSGTKFSSWLERTTLILCIEQSSHNGIIRRPTDIRTGRIEIHKE